MVITDNDGRHWAGPLIGVKTIPVAVQNALAKLAGGWRGPTVQTVGCRVQFRGTLSLIGQTKRNVV